MSKILKALVKHGAVRVEDGRIVPNEVGKSLRSPSGTRRKLWVSGRRVPLTGGKRRAKP